MPGQGHNLELDDHVPRRLRSEGALKDVFAMVKGYMSDQSFDSASFTLLPSKLCSEYRKLLQPDQQHQGGGASGT